MGRYVDDPIINSISCGGDLPHDYSALWGHHSPHPANEQGAISFQFPCSSREIGLAVRTQDIDK